jgi:L-cysteine:1D-myo-inositol 2-amino-2-deoxy-alpha-D-glucopyranoside ligase
MKLFDTRKKQYVDFTPPQTVRIYTCGITPYDSAHLGHILTFMTYDLLQRRLEDSGHTVQLVRNVTDVDEPIFLKAAELGISYTQLADQETKLFDAVLAQLNFRPAFAAPRASAYIEPMAAAVAELLTAGFAYRLEQDVYFDVSKDDKFGDFSGFSDHLQLALMRRRGGDPKRPGKRQPLDFLLWRGIDDLSDTAAWESPLGRGRPGWHIECSVMASSLLGTPFDVHGGGGDLLFPHHECEIAQSRGLGQPELAQRWMHVSSMSYLAEKMSKSLGNLVFAADVLKSYQPDELRLALLHYHYRVGGEWLPELLDEAAVLYREIRSALNITTQPIATTLLAAIRQALDTDLDTHAINHALHCFAMDSAASNHPVPDSEASAIARQALGLLGLALPVTA